MIRLPEQRPQRPEMLSNLQVLFCTQTLALGVNLPARLVVVKGTTAYKDARVDRNLMHAVKFYSSRLCQHSLLSAAELSTHASTNISHISRRRNCLAADLFSCLTLHVCFLESGGRQYFLTSCRTSKRNPELWHILCQLHIRACTSTLTHLHVCRYLCGDVNIHIYIYICTHTHTQARMYAYATYLCVHAQHVYVLK